MKNNLVIGIEIEMEYNKYDIGHIERGAYHGSNKVSFNNSFIAENDGSLKTRRHNSTVELISLPFESKNWREVIKSFEREIYQRVAREKDISVNEAREGYNMKDLINFNESMGTHLHIGLIGDDEKLERNVKNKRIEIPKEHYLNYCIDYETTKRLEKGLYNAIDNERYKDQYYRSYAKKLSKARFKTSRECSINFRKGISNGKIIEIRSFNLLGVKTWEGLFKRLEKAFKYLSNFFKEEMAKEKPFQNKEEYGKEIEEDKNKEIKNKVRSKNKVKNKVILKKDKIGLKKDLKKVKSRC